MRKIPFTKMQGLGNDFVVFNGVEQTVSLTPEQLRHIANRRFGIGCDQILMVLPADSKDVDFQYKIFNADGGEVEQCGNGARCFLRFLYEKKLTTKPSVRVNTLAGILTLTKAADNEVTVDMGHPVFDPDRVPFDVESSAPSYTLKLDHETFEIGVVSMGNPHAVLQVDNVQMAKVAKIGAGIENHPRFPKRANVGFMQVIDRKNIKLRVFERGVGETLACGTGACAAVAVGHIQQILDEKVTVELPGGKLMIQWQGLNSPMMMTGPGETVYEGFIEL